MIHVLVLLDKHGTNTDISSLGALSIRNDGDGTEALGNYTIIQLDKNNKPIKEAKIKGWCRKSKSPMQLVGKCFEELGLTSKKK